MDVPRGSRARLVSWAWDYLVVVVWLALVFLVVGVPQLIGWLDLGWVWSGPLAADVAVTLLTVAPFLTYLTATEAGPARASWGKRRAGLALRDPEGTITVRQVLMRNTLKLLPWQLGHMSAMRFAVGGSSGLDAVVLFVTSLVLLAAVAGPVLLGRIGLHEWVSGTRVRTVASALQG